MIFNYDSNLATEFKTFLGGLPFTVVRLLGDSGITNYLVATEINHIFHGEDLGDQSGVLLTPTEVTKMLLTEALLGNERAISFSYPLLATAIQFRLTNTPIEGNQETNRVINESKISTKVLTNEDSWREKILEEHLI